MERWTKATAFSLHMRATSCPAWLDHQLHRQPSDPFLRWDIRSRLLLRLREAHATMCAPGVADLGSIPGGLLPEQVWFYERFAENYCKVFAGEPGEARLHGCESTSTFQRRHLKVGGAVDLLVTRPDGVAELRQFEL